MIRLAGAVSALTLALALGHAAPAAASEQLLTEACVACHEQTSAGLSRIAGQRKTPEGWLMSIVRMRIAHGMEISTADQATLVAYLSETQGMAPAETAAYRYALEKDPNVVEAFDEPLASMCSRCHTGARVMLQRRTAEEWTLLADFHVGQYPTTEYQALGRDREWFRIAKEEVTPMLAGQLPLETPEWAAWQAAAKASPAGDWVVLTAIPGKGQAYGRLTVAGGASPYTVTGEMRLADGTALPVGGSMNLYTGYEWRANLTVGDQAMRQVVALSEDGAQGAGRQFLRDADSLGAGIRLARADGPATVLGAVPEAAQGQSAAVQIVGAGLGDLAAEGGSLADVAANAFGAAATVSAGGPGVVHVSGAGGTAHVALYDSADRVSVEPDFTIARVGGGSAIAPGVVPAHFTAVGWWNGPDGQPGTEDDIRIGALDAEWSVADRDETSAAMQDVKFAGAMQENGIFMPAIGGPNPERQFSTNNAGVLTVTGTAAGQSGEAHLIVTVQRFIDPPIR